MAKEYTSLLRTASLPATVTDHFNTRPCTDAPLLSSLFPIPLSRLFSFYKVGCAGNIGIMFLNEVALGNEFSLYQDNPSLKSAPGGYESVVARGRTEPGERKKRGETHSATVCQTVYCAYMTMTVSHVFSLCLPPSDAKFDTKIVLDGKEVVVPQGKAIPNPGVTQTSFSQSEYLVYKESQVRIRYLLKMKFW